MIHLERILGLDVDRCHLAVLFKVAIDYSRTFLFPFFSSKERSDMLLDAYVLQRISGRFLPLYRYDTYLGVETFRSRVTCSRGVWRCKGSNDYTSTEQCCLRSQLKFNVTPSYSDAVWLYCTISV